MKTKVLLIIFLFCLFFINMNVHAESKYLYDVLKNEAENGGLAKEYTGEHHDSFTEEPSKKIYHWYAENDDNANDILNTWNVIFGGYCWQMWRTTDTGGVKLIYNGEAGKYDKIPLNQKEYTILTNTGDFTWNSTTSTWDATIIDGQSKEISFTVPEGEGYTMIQTGTSGVSSGGTYTFYKDEVMASSYGNGGGAAMDLTYSFSTLSSKNVIKMAYIGSSSSSSPITFKIKMVKNGDLLSMGCDNSRASQQIGISSFNTNSNSPAYVGYMIPNSSKIRTFSGIVITTGGNLFGKGVNYSNGVYSLTDTSTEYDSTHHYSCNNKTGTCKTVRYNYYNNMIITLDGEENIEEAVHNMLDGNNVNENNSAIKAAIDTWYQNNMIDYTNKLEDTTFCNNRSIINYGGWNPGGSTSVRNYLIFKSYTNSDLSCANITDRFSMSNTNARLTYPVGLMTASEAELLNNEILRKTGEYYWLGSPSYLVNGSAYVYVDGAVSCAVNSTGGINKSGSTTSHNLVNNSNGVRPAVSLAPDTIVSSGDGSINNPYIISEKYSVNIEVKDETKDLNIEINDMTQVEYKEKVKFKVTPIKGYKVNNIKIIDSEDNEIDYITTDNMNYTFIMPASDVTIIPSYERVSSAVNIEENKNTKGIIIEVNDAKAVVYEDIVKFTVMPKDGYEVESIEIKDKNNNIIEYRKTDKDNEYEFTMPASDVIITPYYKQIVKPDNNLTNPLTYSPILIVLFLLGIVFFGVRYIKKSIKA